MNRMTSRKTGKIFTPSRKLLSQPQQCVDIPRHHIRGEPPPPPRFTPLLFLTFPLSLRLSPSLSHFFLSCFLPRKQETRVHVARADECLHLRWQFLDRSPSKWLLQTGAAPRFRTLPCPSFLQILSLIFYLSRFLFFFFSRAIFRSLALTLGEVAGHKFRVG